MMAASKRAKINLSNEEWTWLTNEITKDTEDTNIKVNSAGYKTIISNKFRAEFPTFHHQVLSDYIIRQGKTKAGIPDALVNASLEAKNMYWHVSSIATKMRQVAELCDQRTETYSTLPASFFPSSSSSSQPPPQPQRSSPSSSSSQSPLINSDNSLEDLNVLIDSKTNELAELMRRRRHLVGEAENNNKSLCIGYLVNSDPTEQNSIFMGGRQAEFDPSIEHLICAVYDDSDARPATKQYISFDDTGNRKISKRIRKTGEKQQRLPTAEIIRIHLGDETDEDDTIVVSRRQGATAAVRTETRESDPIDRPAVAAVATIGAIGKAAGIVK